MQLIPPEQQAASSKQQAASSKQRALDRFIGVFFCLAFAFALVFIAPAQQAVSATERPIAKAFANAIQHVKVAHGASSMPVEWSYTNHWNIPLLVERIDSSCGCLAAQIDHQQIAPGVTGVIRATLTTGNQRGDLRRSLFVRFVGFAQSVEIIADISIPSSVALSSSQLSWPVAGSSASASSETQIIDLTSTKDSVFSLTGLLGVQESQFSIIQKTVTPGKHYQLHITPVNAHTTAAISTALQIRTNSTDPRDQVLVVLLYQAPVRP
jgi:hypothetical protein